jgi:hypothetical protein
MSQTETSKNSAVGLDIGTSRIVAARNAGQDVKYDIQLNAFVTIPYSKMTENVLQKEAVPYTVDAAGIMVHGNESERFADLLNKDIRRPMTRGVLNPDETDSVRLIREITASVAGKASKGAKLCFSVPAAPLGAEENLTYHEATIRQIVTELGYEATSINEGLAVVYGELESSNYTGIGISCGGGLCNVCLSYLSVPVISFSIPKAGDFIDSSAASVTGERANRVRLLKEQSFHINGHFNDTFRQALNVYYEDMIQSLVGGLRNAFQSARNLPKMSKPIPLVLSGGTAMPKGFRDRFEKILRESHFPVELSEIRMAAEPLTTTAKGALVAALCDMK